MITGSGILKGLWTTFRHFIKTYLEDIRSGKKRYFTAEGIEMRRSPDVEGIFTIQYPEEKLPVPEEFRYIPFLVYDEGENGEKEIRCTSCGICAKVCPPQCIWIVRTTDPQTGKPIPQPKEFYIDVDICMNCGFCAEFCPFDAIKMDHDYEIASYDRIKEHIFDLERLSKPASYYAQIRPANFAREEAARAEKEAQKAAARKANP
ncbi:MAG: 4Fe-4S binding protein [Chloroflexota bacterium]